MFLLPTCASHESYFPPHLYAHGNVAVGVWFVLRVIYFFPFQPEVKAEPYYFRSIILTFVECFDTVSLLILVLIREL